MSNSLRPHGLQHTRLPCPSLSPGAYSNSCPLSRWYHPTISSSVTHFSSCLQSFPASRSFLTSQFFESGGQSIGASALASVLPMNIQDWFPLGLTGLISWQSKGLSRDFSNTTVQKHQFFEAQPSLWSNSHVGTWLKPTRLADGSRGWERNQGTRMSEDVAMSNWVDGRAIKKKENESTSLGWYGERNQGFSSLSSCSK